MSNNKSFPELLEKTFPNGLERNAYFYGKLLTVRDFVTEQKYFQAKHQLSHKGLHGTGVVWGLGVTGLTSEGIEKIRFKLGQGMALDPEGREILVLEETEHELEVPENLRVQDELIIGIGYREQFREPTPSGSTPKECHWNRVREEYCLKIIKNETLLANSVPLLAIKKQNNKWAPKPSKFPPRISSLWELSQISRDILAKIEVLERRLRGVNWSLALLSKRLKVLEQRYQQHMIQLSAEGKWQKNIKHGLGIYPTVDVYVVIPKRLFIAPGTLRREEIETHAREGGEIVMSYGNIGNFIGAEATPTGRRVTAFESTVVRPLTELSSLKITDRFGVIRNKIKGLEVTTIGEVPDKTLSELHREGFKMALTGIPTKNTELMKPIEVSHLSPQEIHIRLTTAPRTKKISLMVLLRA